MIKLYKNGIDIVYIKRFENIKDGFIEKCFTTNEIEYINTKANKLETMAGIFASKEAFLKSINKGIDDYSLLDIEVLHKNNIPYITLHNELKKDIDYKEISLSISHDGSYAVASVIILLHS